MSNIQVGDIVGYRQNDLILWMGAQDLRMLVIEILADTVYLEVLCGEETQQGRHHLRHSGVGAEFLQVYARGQTNDKV